MGHFAALLRVYKIFFEKTTLCVLFYREFSTWECSVFVPKSIIRSSIDSEVFDIHVDASYEYLVSCHAYLSPCHASLFLFVLSVSPEAKSLISEVPTIQAETNTVYSTLVPTLKNEKRNFMSLCR